MIMSPSNLLTRLVLLFVLVAAVGGPIRAIAAISTVSKERVALIIGNAGYVGWQPLDSPVNDANAMAAALGSLGFKVILKTDADLGAMQQAIGEFRRTLNKGGVGLFYYSGHGVQVDLVNYLIPTRGTVEYAEDIPTASVDLNAVMRAMGEAGTSVNFVILDACRNNPLKRRNKKAIEGLARMDAPKGSLIAYAAGPNQAAADGTRGNSLYTAELLKVIGLPGLQVEDVFKRVRSRIDHVSMGAQIPVEFTSLTSDFYFRPGIVSQRGIGAIRSATDPQSLSRLEVVRHTKVYETLRAIKMREQPRNSAAVVANLAARATIRATGRVKDRDWLRVRTRKGVDGFVPDYLLRPPFTWKEEPHRSTYEVIESTALREEPRSASAMLARFRVGRSVTATAQVVALNWLRVIGPEGTSGFLSRSVLRAPFSFVVDPFDGKYEATTEVKLLAQPRVSAAQVAGLTAREQLTAIGKVRNRPWLKIRRAGGAQGFVPEALLTVPFEWREESMDESTYKTLGKVSLRAEPRSTSTVLASLAVRQTVTSVAKVVGHNWLKIRLGKTGPGETRKQGYVHENLLRMVVPRPDAADYKDGAEFRDCPTCPLMVVLPAGKFTMGSSDNRGERPPHPVSIGLRFAIGKYEVTFEEWDACVADGGCRARPSAEGWGRKNRPVVNINWDDAKEYLRWLSGKTSERYHLPSETQWEYATRAGQTTDYAWGDDIGSNRANCRNCGSKWSGERTAPVGSFKANKFGLHDMHGNVWEWVEDCWHRNYRKAPKDGSPWTSGSCGYSVLRGGSWRDNASVVRSSSRTKYQSVPHKSFGFRAARIIPQ